MTSARRRKRTVMLRYHRGIFVPADETSEAMVLDRGYRDGDILSAELRKDRNPKFHRFVHQLGVALIHNTDDFAEYTSAHDVIKRLQIEANVGCEVTLIKVPHLGIVEHRSPISLAFESMDEAEFRAVYNGLCDYIRRTYWHGFTREQVQEVASLVGMAA